MTAPEFIPCSHVCPGCGGCESCCVCPDDRAGADVHIGPPLATSATASERTASPAGGRIPPAGPDALGGSQALGGQAFRDQWRKARSANARAARNRRGRRPAPPVTGIRIDPPERS